MKVATFLLSIGVLVLAAGQASGESESIYKWVDEEGIKNFSTLPPRDTAAERADVRINRTNPQAIQARASGQDNLDKARAIREGQAAADAQKQELSRQDIANQRVENCSVARQRLTTYSQSRRLYRANADGEREYLTDEELDAARAEAIALVDEWCD